VLALALRELISILEQNHPMRILVVEDEPDLRSALARALRDEGYAVDTAADGEEGLYKAENWSYDAVVLDVMLPKLDGWELLEALRRTKKTPVLMLTARDASRDRVRGLDGGADDYLVKPFGAVPARRARESISAASASISPRGRFRAEASR
jgi:two-component system, OmpR family, response regulator